MLPPPAGAGSGSSAPPQALALSRADYRARLSGDHAEVVAGFEFTGMAREGSSHLPLLLASEVALQTATLDGQPVALASDEGRLGLDLPASEALGDHRIEVRFLVALAGDDPRAQGFSFSTPRAPITLLVVRGLRRDVLPVCSPGVGLESFEEEGERCVRVGLPRTSSLRFSWRPEAERAEVAQRPALVAGAVHTVISVGERALSVRARVELQVSGGPLNALALELPAGFLLHGASGDAVRDARPSRDEQGERLRVRFTHDVLGATSFEVKGEVPLDEGSERVPAPVLALPSDGRARGTVAVEANPRVEVELAEVRGASRVDPSDLSWRPGPALQGAETLLALKFARTRPALTLALKRHKDAPVLVATCDHAHLRALLLEEGKLFVKAHLALRNNARSHLQLGLPDGAELWSAYCGGQPVRPSARRDQPGALIPLLQGRDEAFEVELGYLLRLDALGDQGRVVLPLPALDLPQTHVSLVLFLPERFRHFNFEGGLARVETFSRTFQPPPEAGGAISPMTNLMPVQSFLPAGGGGRGPALGGEGQLPIRLPALERGLEHRFEKALVVEPPAPLAWEYKRRRRTV